MSSPEDLGGLNIGPASSQDTGAAAPVSTGSASEATIQQRKKRSDAGQPRGPRGEKSTGGIPSLSQTQFAQLYDPEIWSKALSAPGDAMAAITGKSLWEISEKERKALGATGAIAAQCFAVTDPRYLALSLALITLLDVYGVRIAMDLAERKREAEKKKRENER